MPRRPAVAPAAAAAAALVGAWLVVLVQPAASGADDAASSHAQQWQPWEHNLTATGSYANPFVDASVTVRFTAPDGRTRTADGFWDGGTVWRVRSFFDAPGSWQWSTASDDVGLRQSGTVSVAAAAAAAAAAAGHSNPFWSHGSLRAGDGHLQHADGTPFFWLGDTAWAGAMRSTEQEWTTYLTVRKTQGFNVVQSGIACPWAGGTTRRGDLPFLDKGNNLTKLNPLFFQVFESRLAQAASSGFGVLLVALMEPSYRYPSPPEATRFARHMAARLAHCNSIMYSPSFDSGYMALGNLVGQALVSAGVKGHQLLTIHPGTGLHNELGYYKAGGKYGEAGWTDFWGEQTGYG